MTILRNANELHADLNSWAARRIDSFTNKVFNQVRKLTPVDTGLTKRSWRKHKYRRNDPEQVILENPVEYAQYLEQGHSKQAPKGMVAPAIQRVLRQTDRGK